MSPAPSPAWSGWPSSCMHPGLRPDDCCRSQIAGSLPLAGSTVLSLLTGVAPSPNKPAEPAAASDHDRAASLGRPASRPSSRARDAYPTTMTAEPTDGVADHLRLVRSVPNIAV